MAIYTIVDQDICIACGVCEALAPDLFKLDEDDFSIYLLDNNQGNTKVPENLMDDFEDAYESCVPGAIKRSSKQFDGDPLKFE